MVHVVKRWREEYHSFLLRLEGVTLRHFRPEFHGMTRFIQRSTAPDAAGTNKPKTLPAT
jgi:hypothetical protein